MGRHRRGRAHEPQRKRPPKGCSDRPQADRRPQRGRPSAQKKAPTRSPRTDPNPAAHELGPLQRRERHLRVLGRGHADEPVPQTLERHAISLDLRPHDRSHLREGSDEVRLRQLARQVPHEQRALVFARRGRRPRRRRPVGAPSCRAVGFVVGPGRRLVALCRRLLVTRRRESGVRRDGGRDITPESAAGSGPQASTLSLGSAAEVRRTNASERAQQV